MSEHPINTAPRASFERVVDALAAAGITVKDTHGGAKSACPLSGHKHGDTNPSLSIQYIAKDGRTRIRCHLPEHMGREEDILRVIGLGFADLYDEPKAPGAGGSSSTSSRPKPSKQAIAPPKPAKPAKSESESRPEIVARYDYLDADGSPVLRVLRYDPKGFRQQKHDGKRWVWGAPAAEDRVLYRLPEVRAAAEANGIVHLNEGEKDADAVAGALGAGNAATTAPMGADKWQPQYTEQLRGAGLVVLWRDKDDSGDRHVRTVSEQLSAAEIPWQIVEAAQGKDAADHLAAGLGLDEVVPVELEEAEVDRDIEQPDAAVVNIDGRRLPDPEHTIPMGRGQWAYEDGGEGRRARGVYTYEKEQGWRRVAPMPYLHKRIVQRDGTGRRTSTAYLASAEPEGPRVVITHDHLRAASWANMLGLALSADDKITKAATTAIIYAAERAAECEETPRVQGGRITIPIPETLPPGYLQTSRYSTDEARAGWAELIHLVAQSPKMALVVGASAIAPFVAATRRQSHFVSIDGDPAQGKTIALNTAAAVWGLASESEEDAGTAVVTSWDASPQGPFRILGELGVLPPFWDEIGQAAYKDPASWGKFIFDVTSGSQRKTPGRSSSQTHYGRPWHGVFITCGNGRLLEGLGAGRHSGIARRVIELSAPMTVDENHANAISAKWEVVYGHAGLQLLEQHSAETVRPLIDAAAEAITSPESAVGRNVARHLHAHIAGAALLDDWAGTGSTLRDAAIAASIEYLESWAEPEHDADRMLNAIRDAMDREPAKWPTISADRAARALDVGLPAEMPRHGVDRSLSGLRDDDDEWVAVYTATWRAFCTDLGLDSAVTARELHRRGVLQVTEAKRRRGEWVTQIRAASSATGMYKLLLTSLLGDELDDTTPAEPDQGTDPTGGMSPATTDGGVGSGGERCGSVVGDVVGAPDALTCDVVGGVGVVGQNLHMRAREDSPQRPIPELITLRGEKPCAICRTPARHSLGGDPIHTGQCMATWLEERAAQPQPAQTATAVAPAAQTAAQPATAKGPRFRAPAAVVDGTTAYLPGAEVVDIEAPRHLGDLAMLVRPDRLALGHGGDRERKPDHGQLWLTAATLTGLGLPLELPNDDKPRANALAQLRSAPAVADAIADGWSLGQQGQMREWTRIWHSELLPQGAWLVAQPWQRLDAALLEGDPHPAELATRLDEFANALGMPYRISPTVTGLDLIDHTRPPLEVGQEPGERKAVVRNEPGEMPSWLRKMDDPRARNVEQDWSWWRLWSSLGEQERECRYVHLYDRNKAYFSSWSGVELGVSGLVHLEGDQAAWDGTEKPAYFRIDRPQWHHTHLPDPGMHLGYPLNDGTIWCTVHTLKALAKHDITPTIHEAYTWTNHARYLDKAAKKLSTLLTDLEPGPIVSTGKEIYTRTTGKLAEIDHDPNYHLWRPDWRDHVIGLNKAMILRSISQTGERTGHYPLVVAGRDTIAYASNDPDPVSGWPGQPGHLGPKPGQWKPAGSGELQPWGPKHLVKRVGRWRPRAFDDLTS